MEAIMDCCQENKYKSAKRDIESVKKLKNRLSRIVGQLNGISNMIDENRYCVDILTQVSAAQSALKEVAYLILDEHLHSCVVEKINEGDTEVLNEVLDIMKKVK